MSSLHFQSKVLLLIVAQTVAHASDLSDLEEPTNQTPPLVSFLNILHTGVEPGIDWGWWGVVANVEAGHVWSVHEFLPRVAQFVHDPKMVDSDANPLTPEYDRHATGVASFLEGPTPIELHSGALATKWSGKAYSGNFSTTPQAMATVYGAFFGLVDVINSSWGGHDPTGDSFPALITDGLANQYPSTTFIASVGNSGPEPNTVGGPGSGYNNIAVGSLQNTQGQDTVAGFSSRGPHDYSDPNGVVLKVRAEVDLVAPGTDLTMAYYGGQSGGNHPSLLGSTPVAGTSRIANNVKGTSFSAPMVANVATQLHQVAKNIPGLLENRYARDARVIKSVLLNSADKIPGWDNGQRVDANGKIITTQSLDWASGAGALNMSKVYDQYLTAGTRDVVGLSSGSIQPVGWDYGQVGLGNTNFYRMDEILQANTQLTVTLNWFRDRTFDTRDMVFQDLGQANLDLFVRDVISNRVIAESSSIHNVVEHLFFTLPTASLYQIEVAYNRNLFGQLKKEEYGLAWSAKPVRQQKLEGSPKARVEPHPQSALPAEPHLPRMAARVARPKAAGVHPRGGWLVAK
ncbi:exported hypothetical protein [Gammaproteobacteria bacterium]